MTPSKPPESKKADTSTSRRFNLRHSIFDIRHSPLPALLLLIAVGAVIYSNTLHAPFVFDDQFFILKDNAVHITDLTPGAVTNAAIHGRPFYRLIPNASFALNYYFGGYDPLGYHLVNIGIHLLAGIFLFFFIKDILTVDPSFENRAAPGPDPLKTAPVLAAFFAALIWLAHPVATQTVTYICQRMAGLAAMFYILSLLLYGKGRIAMRATPHRRSVSLLCFAGCGISGIFAFASKQNAATLPFFILVVEWFFFQDLKFRFSRRRIMFMAVAAVIFAGIALIYLGDAPVRRVLTGYARRDFTPYERVLTESRVIIYYISLFFWPAPSRLNLDHDYPLSLSPVVPFTTILCLGAVAALLAAALYAARKDRLLSFGLLWFLGTLAIESSIIPIEIIFEHRTYLPFMLISPVFVLLVLRGVRIKPLAWGILCAAAVLLSLWTFQRNRTWEAPVSFWSDCVQKSPEKYRPHNDLGVALYDAGDLAGATAQYQKALQIDPGSAETLNNLGNTLLKQGRTDAAIASFTRALNLSPGYAKAENNLGTALLQKGEIQQAANCFKAVLGTQPDNVEANLNLGAVLSRLNQPDQALIHYQRALKTDPYNPEAENNIGVLFAQKHMYKEARRHFNRALALRPGYASAENNLARLTQLEEKLKGGP